MENPATWGVTERVIHAAIVEHARGLERGVIGLSVTRTVADALREAGLLVEESEEHHPEWEACKR